MRREGIGTLLLRLRFGLSRPCRGLADPPLRDMLRPFNPKSSDQIVDLTSLTYFKMVRREGIEPTTR